MNEKLKRLIEIYQLTGVIQASSNFRTCELKNDYGKLKN